MLSSSPNLLLRRLRPQRCRKPKREALEKNSLLEITMMTASVGPQALHRPIGKYIIQMVLENDHKGDHETKKKTGTSNSVKSVQTQAMIVIEGAFERRVEIPMEI
jgi:hypothetical protein